MKEKKFKKYLNMVIGKRQIVLAALTLILTIAIYLNWQLAGSDLTLTDSLDNSNRNYGDTTLVDATQNGSYFAEARLSKKTARDQATETLKNLLKDSSLTEKQLADATAKALNMSKNIDNESAVENLIKAKGFVECLAYIDEERANIVVKTTGLDSAQVAQIRDIVLSHTNVINENITITEVK
ncbi:MAG: SpoIIIAH-like family protein [Oscillospiraceae bacterium]|nr:SpoIIIAH-like family protein [Oscillospiraceae bacterium]